MIVAAGFCFLGDKGLLFRLFVHGRSPAPLAVLFEFDLADHQLLVLAGPIVDALALRALQLYKAIL
jgi:hypothetical protein